jgi:hypothetical protein
MVNWDLILETIESEKCVLVLGPEIRQNENGIPINEELYQFLDIKNNSNILKFYENDELFLFADGMSKSMVYYNIKKFINSTSISDIYSKISQLPFHLFISINNDLFLCNAFKSNNLESNFAFYNKNLLSPNVEPPTKIKPLIYNIMGCIEHEESIILDYDDLLEFLFSVLGTKPLPLELKNCLQNTSNFIFLGFSFEMKFLQILLKLLNFNMKHKIKFSFSKELPSGVKTFYIDQFKISFISGGVDSFINELYSKYHTTGKLRKPISINLNLHDKIEEMISQNRLKEALNEMKLYFRKNDESEYNMIIILQSRLNALEDKTNAGMIEYAEAEIERNKLRAAVIASVNKIK